MKKLLLASGLLTLLSAGTVASAHADTVYRNYNSSTGEHLYTANKYEWSQLPLESSSWQQDSVTFNAPSTGANVYRVYNPNSGEHLFTISSYEKNSLLKLGWKSEGVAFHSGGKTPVYRLYNPHAGVGAHLDTANAYEKTVLQKTGWKYEGVAWYAEGQGSVSISSGTYYANVGPTVSAKIVIESKSYKEYDAGVYQGTGIAWGSLNKVEYSHLMTYTSKANASWYDSSVSGDFYVGNANYLYHGSTAGILKCQLYPAGTKQANQILSRMQYLIKYQGRVVVGNNAPQR